MTKRLWKTFIIDDTSLLHDIRSTIGEWKDRDWMCVIDGEVNTIETNAPIDELRAIFRSVGRKLPSDYVTDAHPSWK